MDTCSRMRGTRRGSFRAIEDSLETSEEQLKLWVDNFSILGIILFFEDLSKNMFRGF